LLTVSCLSGYHVLQRESLVPLAWALWTGAWSGLFVGYVTAVSSSLQVRRTLLLGLLEPSAREWRWLENSQPAGEAWFWTRIGLAALGLSTATAGFVFLVAQAGGGLGIGKWVYVGCVAGLPTAGAGIVAVWAGRSSIRRFVASLERDRPLRLGRLRYILLHVVLPYSLFSSLVGVAMAFSRFLPAALAGRGLPAKEVASHLAFAALLITLVVVGAARIKARVDFLGPVELVAAPGSGPRVRWRWWFSLVASLLIWAGLRLAFWSAQVQELSVRSALLLKLIVCLALSLGTAWWAVASVWFEMEKDGPPGHRFVRVYRFMRRAGFLAKR
jgi:hypothetical protein